MEASTKTPASAWSAAHGRGKPDPQDAVVIVRRGELLCGVLDKSAFGATEFGLVLNGIWNIVKWFLDPRTRAKFEMVTSNQALLDLFDRDQLPGTLGGTAAVQLPC